MKQLSGEVKALTEQAANAKERLDELLARAARQSDELERLRVGTAAQVLAGDAR